MEPRRFNTARKSLLLSGLTLMVLLVTSPTSAIDIYTDPEVIVENGTAGVLRCTFRSSQVVSSYASVTWSFQSNNPDSPFNKGPHKIFYYYNKGGGVPVLKEFEGRIQFLGDMNKRDVSIQISPTHFSDNGTYFCDVNNVPDMGMPGRTELRVVLKVRAGSLPQVKTAVIVGAVSGVLLLLVLIAVAACVAMRVLHNRHDYEGCTSLESVNSRAPQPPKKAESNLEGSRCTSPSGPLQGPVIYAQLDHSGSKNSFHKMEPVVYADIRKN